MKVRFEFPRWTLFAALLVIPVLGCNDGRLTSQGTEETPSPTPDPSYWEDVYSQHAEGKVDVLWVVDSSGSMQQEQDKLAESFADFIQYFTSDEIQLDWQLAIVTTDVFDTSHRGKFVGNVLTPDTPDVVSVFQNDVNVGTSGSGREQGLEAARLALSEPNLSGTNAGFLRDDALLSVIFVSDEDDQSYWDDSAGFNCTGANESTDNCTPVQDYLDFFYGLKTRDDLVHFSVIVGPQPSGCDNSYGVADPAFRYENVADITRGVSETICAQTFGPTLEHLGEVISSLVRNQFPMTYQAEPTSVEVRINDVLIPSGPDTWKFDAEAGAVVFHPDAAPPECAELQISYIRASDEPLLSEPVEGMGYDPQCLFGDPYVPPTEEPFIGDIDGGAIACAVSPKGKKTGVAGLLALGLLAGLAVLRRRR